MLILFPGKPEGMKSAALYGMAALASAALLFASLTQALPITWPEVVAFVTGAWCVWLTVRENIWNWPIGLANATFSGVVFFQGKLFADAVLQGVYFVLGVFGWYWWLYGGKERTELRVERAPARELCLVLFAGAISTLGVWKLLIHFNGAAPFLDALLTSFSLCAQYLLTRKYLENWIVWIAVDIVYIPLFVSRQLYLIAILYTVFLVLAVLGYQQWRQRFRLQAAA